MGHFIFLMLQCIDKKDTDDHIYQIRCKCSEPKYTELQGSTNQVKYPINNNYSKEDVKHAIQQIYSDDIYEIFEGIKFFKDHIVVALDNINILNHLLPITHELQDFDLYDSVLDILDKMILGSSNIPSDIFTTIFNFCYFSILNLEEYNFKVSCLDSLTNLVYSNFDFATEIFQTDLKDQLFIFINKNIPNIEEHYKDDTDIIEYHYFITSSVKFLESFFKYEILIDDNYANKMLDLIQVFLIAKPISEENNIKWKTIIFSTISDFVLAVSSNVAINLLTPLLLENINLLVNSSTNALLVVLKAVKRFTQKEDCFSLFFVQNNFCLAVLNSPWFYSGEKYYVSCVYIFSSILKNFAACNDTIVLNAVISPEITILIKSVYELGSYKEKSIVIQIVCYLILSYNEELMQFCLSTYYSYIISLKDFISLEDDLKLSKVCLTAIYLVLKYAQQNDQYSQIIECFKLDEYYMIFNSFEDSVLSQLILNIIEPEE